MAGISLSTAGILFGYGVETVKGQKPSAFTQIERAMSLPALNPQPESLDVTPLDATEWKEYIAGLKDTGGALPIRFSLNNALKTAWGKFVEAYNTAKESDLNVWAEFYIPGMTDAFFFTCEPTPLGFGGAEVNAHLEVEAYITPTGNIGWATAVKPDPEAA
jgi:hypothetical protein